MLSNKGELRREAECASALGTKVQMVQCEHLRSDDLWELRLSGELYSKRAARCLTVEEKEGKYLPKLSTCDPSPEQVWVFDQHKEQFTLASDDENELL
jgi:hypothetical protein